MRRAAAAAAALAGLFVAACGGAPGEPRTAADEEDETPWAVALRFTDAGEGASGDPRTLVALVTIAPDGARRVEELGTEAGACFGEPPPEGALLAARCWWAGTGAVYLVVRDGDHVRARRGPDARHGFTDVGAVEVPAEETVRVLGAPVGRPEPL